MEKAERGKTAQLAYSFDIALQNEFSLEENIALARQFLLENFVSRGMGRQENIGADHAALAGVVAVFAVILAIQSLPGTVGGRSNSGLSCASLSLRDAQMK